jgi:hypothetical protein
MFHQMEGIHDGTLSTRVKGGREVQEGGVCEEGRGHGHVRGRERKRGRSSRQRAT